MYVNPWKFEVGDLVECRLLEPTLPLVLSSAIRKSGSAMIIDRRRKEVYVEARPMRIVEMDEYCIMIDGTGHWAPEEALALAQKKTIAS